MSADTTDKWNFCGLMIFQFLWGGWYEYTIIQCVHRLCKMMSIDHDPPCYCSTASWLSPIFKYTTKAAYEILHHCSHQCNFLVIFFNRWTLVTPKQHLGCGVCGKPSTQQNLWKCGQSEITVLQQPKLSKDLSIALALSHPISVTSSRMVVGIEKRLKIPEKREGQGRTAFPSTYSSMEAAQGCGQRHNLVTPTSETDEWGSQDEHLKSQEASCRE